MNVGQAFVSFSGGVTFVPGCSSQIVGLGFPSEMKYSESCDAVTSINRYAP
jgi:hypothetical protein